MLPEHPQGSAPTYPTHASPARRVWTPVLPLSTFYYEEQGPGWESQVGSQGAIAGHLAS